MKVKLPTGGYKALLKKTFASTGRCGVVRLVRRLKHAEAERDAWRARCDHLETLVDELRTREERWQTTVTCLDQETTTLREQVVELQRLNSELNARWREDRTLLVVPHDSPST